MVFNCLEIFAKANTVILHVLCSLHKSSISALLQHFFKTLIRVISCRLLSMLSFPCTKLGTEDFRMYKLEINGSSWPNYFLRYGSESFQGVSWQDVHSLSSLGGCQFQRQHFLLQTACLFKWQSFTLVSLLSGFPPLPCLSLSPFF